MEQALDRGGVLVLARLKHEEPDGGQTLCQDVKLIGMLLEEGEQRKGGKNGIVSLFFG